MSKRGSERSQQRRGDFEAEGDSELDVKVGELVILIKDDEEGWAQVAFADTPGIGQKA